jgi:hypothetical protein
MVADRGSAFSRTRPVAAGAVFLHVRKIGCTVGHGAGQDIVRELPGDPRDLQVHRSHCVACSAIAEAVRDGQNMKLVLLSGDSVPVSRSFRSTVETRLNNCRRLSGHNGLAGSNY